MACIGSSTSLHRTCNGTCAVTGVAGSSPSRPLSHPLVKYPSRRAEERIDAFAPDAFCQPACDPTGPSGTRIARPDRSRVRPRHRRVRGVRPVGGNTPARTPARVAGSGLGRLAQLRRDLRSLPGVVDGARFHRAGTLPPFAARGVVPRDPADTDRGARRSPGLLAMHGIMRAGAAARASDPARAPELSLCRSVAGIERPS